VSAAGELDFAALADAYESQLPIYAGLCRRVEALLRDELRQAGVRGIVTSRPKDVTKFLEKAFRKRDQYSDPLTDIHDKAGARVVVTYQSDVERVRSIVRERFRVHREEDTLERLGDATLGYLGVHFEVSLLAEDESDQLAGSLCEIQIHTRAQTAWSEVSHDLLYKSRRDPPVPIARRIMRLGALIELFDEEVDRARKAIVSEPGLIEAKLLAYLEPHFYRIGGEEFDEEVAMEVLGTLKEILTEAEKADFSGLVEEFMSEKGPKLAQIFGDYRETTRRDPLLIQPSTILLFERLETVEVALETEWAKTLPISSLQRLSTIWGRPVAT
jgi:ppGpp synthetase/RelA/SpoT-type nucleotidyltranferase